MLVIWITRPQSTNPKYLNETNNAILAPNQNPLRQGNKGICFDLLVFHHFQFIINKPPPQNLKLKCYQNK
jgi:hypothetical protein